MKLKKLIELVEFLIKGSFTGSVSIHFNQGGIAKIEKNENVVLQ